MVIARKINALKYLVFILICVFICVLNNYSLGQERPEKYDLASYGLKNNVKKLTYRGYYVKTKFGFIIKKQIKKGIGTILFDKNGDVIEGQSRDFETEYLPERILYKYDEFRRLVEIDDITKDQRYFTRRFFKYDSKGNQIEQIGYDSANKLYLKIINKYDSNSNKTDQSQYWDSVRLMRREIFSFNKSNKIVKEYDYYPGDTLNMVKDYFYDSLGYLIKEEGFSVEDSSSYE